MAIRTSVGSKRVRKTVRTVRDEWRGDVGILGKYSIQTLFPWFCILTFYRIFWHVIDCRIWYDYVAERFTSHMRVYKSSQRTKWQHKAGLIDRLDVWNRMYEWKMYKIPKWNRNWKKSTRLTWNVHTERLGVSAVQTKVHVAHTLQVAVPSRRV